jgi:hypothetical protein
MEFLGRFLVFADKPVAFVGAEKIIGALASPADLSRALDLHFTLSLDEACPIFHVPAERAEEGIEKVVAQLRFGITRLLQFREAFAEGLYEPM